MPAPPRKPSVAILHSNSNVARALESMLRLQGLTDVDCPAAATARTLVFASATDMLLVEPLLICPPSPAVTGLTLAREFLDAGGTVVLIGYGPPEQNGVWDLLRDAEHVAYWDLDLPLREIAYCVAKHIPRRRFPNCLAQFEIWKQETDRERQFELGGSGVWQLLADNLGSCSPTPEECAALFRRLIPSSVTRLEFTAIPTGQSGALVLRALVRYGDDLLTEELAIKYGLKAAIQTERMHYKRFVEPLSDGVAARLRMESESDSLGALAYAWVGNSIEDGVPIGPRREGSDIVSWERRRKVIETLFTISLNSWFKVYRTGSITGTRTLLSCYDSPDGIDLEAAWRGVQLPCVPPEASSSVRSVEGGWYFPLLGPRSEPLTDPVRWVLNYRRPMSEQLRLAPCHGDLHVRNLYILPDDSPRLIDFGGTTPSHMFRDFAALEASLLLTCVRDTDLRALMRAQDRLCGVRELGQDINCLGLGGSRDLQEAVRTACKIRQTAYDAVAYGMDPRQAVTEYFFALVMHMLRYATGRADELKERSCSSVPKPPMTLRRAVRMWHAHYAAARAAKAALALLAQ